VKVKGIVNTTPIGILIDGKSNLANKELVELSLMGISAANGTYYIKIVNSKLIELYNDALLLIPAPAVGMTNVASGNIDRIYYKYATPYFSDRKIDVLGQPTPNKPMYAISDGTIKCYPLSEVCYEATADYFAIPPVFIDVDDTQLDLETIYPGEFIYHVIDQATKMYASQSRDQYLNQDATIELVQNP